MDFDIGLQRAIFASMQSHFEIARAVAYQHRGNYPSTTTRAQPLPPPPARMMNAGGGGGGGLRQSTQQQITRTNSSNNGGRAVGGASRSRGGGGGEFGDAGAGGHGKRSTLAREGILPTTPSKNQQRSGGGGGGGGATRVGGGRLPPQTINKNASPSEASVPWIECEDEDGGGGGDDDGGQQLVLCDQQQQQKPSDTLVGWSEIVGCCGRVQRQSRDQSHFLLIPHVVVVGGGGSQNDDKRSGGGGGLLSSDAIVGLIGDAPLTKTPSMMIAVSVQHLGGRGIPVCCFVGVTVNSPSSSSNSKQEVFGASVFYDSVGTAFVSADRWEIDDTSGACSCCCKRLSVLQGPVPVRLLKDKITLQLRFRPSSSGSSSSSSLGSFDVAVNQECIFSGVSPPHATADVQGGDGDDTTSHPVPQLHPVIFAFGGTVSIHRFDGANLDKTTAAVDTSSSSPPLRRMPIVNNNNTTGKPAALPRANSSSSTSGGGLNKQQSKAGSPSATMMDLPPNVDRDLAARIEQEILDRSPNVAWDDIAGMTDAKRLLNEAVVLPLLVPELFTGLVQPWKGVLMFGPPGTGKTMLAKAVATSAKTTFFNVSSSVLLHKHFGESEKMIRTLFQVARARSPSTIFFDEVDAIMGARGASSEHDAMRRVKSELLQQMDGLHSSVEEGGSRVMVLATTNRPWDLDEAIRRRLEKRIYVPLPDLANRVELLLKLSKQLSLDKSVHLEAIARRTEGFSGADLSLLCRNAAMMPMRRLVEGKAPEQLAAMKARGEMVLGAVTESDFEAALSSMSPSVSRLNLSEFDAWTREFGSV